MKADVFVKTFAPTKYFFFGVSLDVSSSINVKNSNEFYGFLLVNIGKWDPVSLLVLFGETSLLIDVFCFWERETKLSSFLTLF